MPRANMEIGPPAQAIRRVGVLEVTSPPRQPGLGWRLRTWLAYRFLKIAASLLRYRLRITWEEDRGDA